ncbi:hypothetical protein Fuma_00375 [Fuerstiella marisgermanici]|uniref:Uncharacterized protein n=1 Tax=Fuerstiella marisgermanici TaxID=1891926 RepID=A0A1P8W9R5_9PLAN|nr:hypothetical protein Fuma_00375 [Fuerstiella marisgermanici]
MHGATLSKWRVQEADWIFVFCERQGVSRQSCGNCFCGYRPAVHLHRYLASLRRERTQIDSMSEIR